MKKLYLLSTGLGDYYVIADDPTEAQSALEDLFTGLDYGFDSQRRVENIKLITSAFSPDYRDKTIPSVGKDNEKLFIISDWGNLKS